MKEGVFNCHSEPCAGLDPVEVKNPSGRMEDEILRSAVGRLRMTNKFRVVSALSSRHLLDIVKQKLLCSHLVQTVRRLFVNHHNCVIGFGDNRRFNRLAFD